MFQSTMSKFPLYVLKNEGTCLMWSFRYFTVLNAALIAYNGAFLIVIEGQCHFLKILASRGIHNATMNRNVMAILVLYLDVFVIMVPLRKLLMLI